MIIKPIDDKNSNFQLVELRDHGNIGRLTPHCKEHGAMNKVSRGGIWRCITAESKESVQIKKGVWETISKGYDCRAGCVEIED